MIVLIYKGNGEYKMFSFTPSMYSQPTSPCSCDSDDCLRVIHKQQPPSSPILVPQKAPTSPPPVRRKTRNPHSLLTRATMMLNRAVFPIDPPTTWPPGICAGTLLPHPEMDHGPTVLEVHPSDMTDAWMMISHEIENVPFRAHVYVKDIMNTSSALCYESNGSIGVLPFEDDYVFDIIDARGMFALNDGSLAIVTTQTNDAHGLTNICPVCRIVQNGEIESVQLFLEQGTSLLVNASNTYIKNDRHALAKVRQWTLRALAQYRRRRIYFTADSS